MIILDWDNEGCVYQIILCSKSLVPIHIVARFGQFFLEPLFTETATERELNAVHSEHSKNVASDAWRINQLERHLGDPSHDFHKFGTGNLSTLDEVPKSKGINIR